MQPEITMEAHHKRALDKALAWVYEHFQPIGIIVTGSIIRGNPDKNSDFDIYVIHEENYRRRIQKYFDGVPCEIFVNNFKHIYNYFEEDYKNNRPVSAHMISTGSVIMGGENQEMERLIRSAKEFLLKAPVLTDGRKTMMKYAISTMFEDATDVRYTDPVTSSYFLDKLMLELIEFIFLTRNIPLPRPKERIKYLKANYPDIGTQIDAYYKAMDFNDKYATAKAMVEGIAGECGFFEWDSGED